jgi:Domain of unknown function (DUF6265)
MRTQRASPRLPLVIAAAAGLLAVSAGAQAQNSPPSTPAQPAPPAAAKPAAEAPAAAAPSPLDQLAWLRGCWAGKVVDRDFIEQWSAPRGGMMVGISQTIVPDKKDAGYRTQDYEYLRLEARADGVYYVDIPSGKKETAFKLTSVGEQLGRTAYTFSNPAEAFPQRIVYLRGSEGWLYAEVAGKVGDHPREVTYPMRHVDCMSGAALDR